MWSFELSSFYCGPRMIYIDITEELQQVGSEETSKLTLSKNKMFVEVHPSTVKCL